MDDRFDGVYLGLREILDNTLGRQVKVFGKLQELDDTKILENYELKKDDSSRSLRVELRFKDSSCCNFDRVVAAAIDWGFVEKRVAPLVWLCEEAQSGSFNKLLFDVKH